MKRLKSVLYTLTAGVCAAVLLSSAAFAETELLDGVLESGLLENGSRSIVTETRGLEGPVRLQIGVTSEGTVEAILVLEHSETPALGGNALKAEYLDNYIGRNSTDDVDAYAGATVTSDAIKACIELALNQYRFENGLDFDKPMTAEEKRDAALEEKLGEDYTEVTLETYADARILNVYESEEFYAVYAEGTGHFPELPIRLLVVADKTGKLTDIVVLESSETEGIGSNVLKDTNLAFYVDGSHFTLIDMGDITKTKIDVVSGATETSFGVFKMINAATLQFDALIAAK